MVRSCFSKGCVASMITMDAIGEAYGVQRAADGKLFQGLSRRARAFAQARRVVKQYGAAVGPPNGAAIESRVRPGSGPVSERSAPRI